MVRSVHPRGCGEHACRDSSLLAAIRFIPAGAGNTRVIPIVLIVRHGSSPRVRGTRFIGDQPIYRSVHPRGCGEHYNASGRSRHSVGSSPRVRGTRADGIDLSASTAVHPRGCGEHSRTYRSLHNRRLGSSPRVRGTRLYPDDECSSTGSSPRVRGTPTQTTPDGLQWRFIPAGAGNTDRSQPGRLCSTGSSPRVRGTRLRRAVERQLARFIPAGAGNTCTGHLPTRPGYRFIPAGAGNTAS